MNRARRAASLAELVTAFVVLGVVLAPAIATMRRQVADTRWSNERLMAIQLADELLDYYKHIGYQGLRLALTNDVPPLTVPLPLDGVRANDFLVYDSWSGDGSQHLYPSGKNPPANGVNPCLGGPGDVAFKRWFVPPDFVPPMPISAGASATELTLRRAFHFRRRVEIFGGDHLVMPPPPNHFQPLPGMTRGLDCYLIRVTIETRQSGTMVRPADQYQVVTVLARH